MKIFLLCLLSFFSLSADLPTIYPPALQKGQLIALVFPASPLQMDLKEAEALIERKRKWLHAQGYSTTVYPPQIRVHGYLAGSDEERANALMAAWKNPAVKAIWCFRGGYGTPRLLDRLDYEWIKKHPKIFIGMSDITALHAAIQAKTGLVTFLAPCLNYFNEKESSFDAAYALASIEKMLVEQKAGSISVPSPIKVLRSGKASGKLVGGNLALIAALCGTPWQLNTDNKILLLEDVGEENYRIDRMLWQLKAAGLFKNPAAVILASWKDCKTTQTHSLTLDQIFNDYFGKASYPVITNFPSGHDSYQTILPLNGVLELDTSTLQVKIPLNLSQNETPLRRRSKYWLIAE